MKNSTQITCPNCDHHFDVEEVLALDLEKQIKDKFQKDYAQKMADLKTEKENFEENKRNENEIFKQKLEKALIEKQKELDKKTDEKYAERIKKLEAENAEKAKENKDLLEKEIALLELQNDLKEKEERLNLDVKKKLLEGKSEYENSGKLKAQQEFELREKELLKKIKEQTDLANEMKRKSEQGSMQLQGEVLELALEDFLHQNFRWDKIEEVQKGTLGADVLQTVNNEMLQNCGKIIYETKRTKNFDQKWLDKLKQDQLNAKAEIAVLVTETLPKNIEKFDVHNGIWICSYQEVKSLVVVLRQILIETQKVKIANENRGDKMEILYSYFTSGEFSQKTKRILEIYNGMLTQLDAEKKVTQKLWAKREKDITIMKENLSIVSGDIAGITGKEINLLEEYDALILE